MANVTLILTDATITVPISLFESHKSSVVILMLDSFKGKDTPSDIEQTGIELNITLVQWNTLRLLLEGRILATHLSPEMYDKASRLGFTSDVTHFNVEREKDLFSEKCKQIDAFYNGHGRGILVLTKEEYHSMKTLIPPSVVPVGVLVEKANKIAGIIVHDNVLIQVYGNKSEPVLENFDVNELKHKLCYNLLNMTVYPVPSPQHRHLCKVGAEETQSILFGNLEEIIKGVVQVIVKHGNSWYYGSVECHDYKDSPHPVMFEGKIRAGCIIDVIHTNADLIYQNAEQISKCPGYVYDVDQGLVIERAVASYTMVHCFVRLNI